MAKYNIYAVAYGIDPKTKEPAIGLKFKTWEECKPYVVGVEGAKYKGFLTDDEADAWLDKKMEEMTATTINTNDTGVAVSKSEVSMIDDTVQKRFEQVCNELNTPVEKTIKFLMEQYISQYEYITEHKVK